MRSKFWDPDPNGSDPGGSQFGSRPSPKERPVKWVPNSKTHTRPGSRLGQAQRPGSRPVRPTYICAIKCRPKIWNFRGDAKLYNRFITFNSIKTVAIDHILLTSLGLNYFSSIKCIEICLNGSTGLKVVTQTQTRNRDPTFGSAYLQAHLPPISFGFCNFRTQTQTQTSSQTQTRKIRRPEYP